MELIKSSIVWAAFVLTAFVALSTCASTLNGRPNLFIHSSQEGVR